MKLPSVNVFKKAYQTCGVKPMNGGWYEKGAACPLGVLALYKGIVNKKMSHEKRQERALKWANETFGEDVVQNFIDGVDSEDPCEDEDDPVEKFGYDIYQEVSR